MIAELWSIEDLRPGEEDHQYLSRRYAEMLVSGRAAIRLTFDPLARNGAGPIIFFCSAAKDRTGVMAALILSALGVDREQVADDYALSADRVSVMLRVVTERKSRHREPVLEQPAPFLASPRKG